MNPIKRLAELTNKEILAIKMNSEEYNNIIDLECAHSGIGLLPEHPGNEPVKTNAQPDSTLYSVGSWGFTSAKDAEDVIQYMIDKGIWRAETKTNVSVMVPMEENSYYWPDIKRSQVYTEDTYKQIADTIKATATVYAVWKEKNSIYQAVVKERQSVVDAFAIKVEYAQEIEDNTAQILSNLKRYLTLAQGSYPIAATFLKEADRYGNIHIENENIYYVCTSGKQHLVMTREQHQRNSMDNLLGVNVKE